MEDDEETWLNEDDDEEEGETLVEKSKSEEDFPESYEKYMEAKKGEVALIHDL